MDIKKLQGIAVVDIDRGEKVGTVDDLLVDAEKRSIAAIKVSEGGVFKKGHRYLPYENISSVGDDAVMIASEQAISETFDDNSRTYHSMNSIGKLRVVTDTGTFVGNVSTAHFDPATGTLTEIEVGDGGIGGLFTSNTLIDANSLVSVGEDIAIVPAHIAEKTG